MKKIKPVGIDLHIKYLCPHCESVVWLSLKEAQTPRYIVVCDYCKNHFKVKTIKKIHIEYIDSPINTKKNDSIVLDDAIKNKCVETLVSYGFTKKEATDLILETFIVFKTNEVSTLVKESLKLFGAKNG